MKIKQFVPVILSVFFSPMIFASQACLDNVLPSTPDSAFTINNDGTVTHSPTGLIWKVCAEGQTWSNGSCLSIPTEHNWQEALQIPETLNASGGYAGYSNWRLPNIKELSSIAEFQCTSPSVNETIFPATPSNQFWSSSVVTNYHESLSGRWVFDFDYTGIYEVDSTFSIKEHNVRLVRDIP